MSKTKQIFSALLAVIFTTIVFLNYIPASAATRTPIPSVRLAKSTSAEYTVGDRVSVSMYAPNYTGKVQYRVALYNVSKKTSQDIWNAKNGFPTNYNTKSIYKGTSPFTISTSFSDPGNYKIIVYVKRYGISQSKTANPKLNYDSYTQTAIFKVDPKPMILNTENGVYGSSDTKQYVKTNVYVNANNFTLNNANITGNVYLNGDNATLNNVNVYGTLYINPGGSSSFNLNQVNATNGVIQAVNGDTCELSNASIQNLTLNIKRKITFIAGDNFYVGETTVNSDVILNQDKGNFGTVQVLPNAQKITTVELGGGITQVNAKTNAVIKNTDSDSSDPTRVDVDYSGSQKISVTLDGRFGDVYVNKTAAISLAANSLIDSIRANDNIDVYGDGTSTVTTFGRTLGSKTIYVHGKINYINEDHVIFINTPSDLPSGNNIAGTIKPQMYFDTTENDAGNGNFIEAFLKLRFQAQDGTDVNVLNGGRFYVVKNGSITSYNYYGSNIYPINVNLDDGTLNFGAGSWKYYVPAQGNKWYVLSFTTAETVKGKTNRTKITSINGSPYSYTKWAAPKYSVLTTVPKLTYVTIGSTISDVRRILGTPFRNSLSQANVVYYYPKALNGKLTSESYIHLDNVNNKYVVTGWYNDGNNINVKITSAVSSAAPFKAGDSMQQVANAMGTPLNIEHSVLNNESIDKWQYKLGYVVFDNEKVIGWSNYGGLKVNMGTKNTNAPGIAIGSSKQDVVSAMGTPPQVYYDFLDTAKIYWKYGDYSTIGFDPVTGKVNQWSDNVNLKLKSADPSAPPFSIGSSEADVTNANGAPDDVNLYSDGTSEWDYYKNGGSTVTFSSDGKVIKWSSNGFLKLAQADPSAAPFTLGSSESDVIAASGAPRYISINPDGSANWTFIQPDGNASAVNFDKDGKVISWNNNGILKIAGTDPSAAPFSAGSSEADVLKANGGPQSITNGVSSGFTWTYSQSDGNNSTVAFDKDGNVIGWNNKGNLNVSMGNAGDTAFQITIGTSMDDVVKAYGTPETYTEDYDSNYTLGYGSSVIYFDSNKNVNGWDDKGDVNVYIGDKGPNSNAITLGSTLKDVVLDYGTPQTISTDYGYFYGYRYTAYININGQTSSITFDKDWNVIGWDNQGGLNVSVGDKISDAPPIQIGSTKDDVVNYLGTPNKIQANVWYYQQESIVFSSDWTVENIY